MEVFWQTSNLEPPTLKLQEKVVTSSSLLDRLAQIQDFQRLGSRHKKRVEKGLGKLSKKDITMTMCS